MHSLFANLLVFSLIAGFCALSVLNPSAYYQHVQEDQPLEWLTFWVFIVAAFFYMRAAVGERRLGKLPWFLAGLAAFCIVVAMEEISWGQRLFGYQPPRYFLENNFQQELNLHNVIATSLRKQLLGAILAGYGLLLPLLHRIAWSKRWLTKLQITAPPRALAPIFVALLALLVTYPLRYTGELIEAGMALAFLFAALDAAWRADPAEVKASPWPAVMGALSVAVVLAFGSAFWSRGQLAADPVVAEVAATELRAIEQDLRALVDEGTLRCGKHERLNQMAKRSRSESLTRGSFRGLVGQGLPEERGEFFIDPWATAYWVRTTCNDKRAKVFVYSFGPNRRRDSRKWRRGGDDIGLLFRVRKSAPAEKAVVRQD